MRGQRGHPRLVAAELVVVAVAAYLERLLQRGALTARHLGRMAVDTAGPCLRQERVVAQRPKVAVAMLAPLLRDVIGEVPVPVGAIEESGGRNKEEFSVFAGIRRKE